MKYRGFTILLLLFSVFSLSAMTNCPAPAPSTGAIVEEGSNFISIRWDEVPGAISYEVTTIDANSGENMASDITEGSQFAQLDLQVDREYLFEIRASYCWGGPYGQPLVLRAKTTIIIVDVILQMECLDDELIPIYSGSLETGDKTNIDISPDDEGCYLINVSSTGLDPNVDLSMIIKANNWGGLTLSNFLSNISNFQLFGLGPVLGVLTNPNPFKTIPIMSVSGKKNKNGDLEAEFIWLQDVIVTVSYCPDCELIKPGHLRVSPSTFAQSTEIKIYPNPVANLLQLQIPRKGLVEIWDLTGRRWFNREVQNDEEDFAIDTNNWPSGTYTLRWNEGSGSPPKIKHFLKL